jgi:hypothetical protein
MELRALGATGLLDHGSALDMAAHLREGAAAQREAPASLQHRSLVCRKDSFLHHASDLCPPPPLHRLKQGLSQNPSLGRHLLHMQRSEIRLVQGNAEGGLEDARAAAEWAPAGFVFPYVLQVRGEG